MNNLSKTFRYVNADGGELVFDFSHGFLINKPRGIDTVSIKLNEAQGIDQTGTTVQSVNVQSRPVTVSGILVGDAQDENKEALLSVVRPDLYGKLYANEYYLDVRPTATPTVEAQGKFAAFQFSLTAPYPYWMKDDTVKATLSGVKYGFKFPWNQAQPYRFGTVVTAQFINVRNGGQVPVPFTLTFTALNEVENPQILDASTGKFLRVNKTLAAGERVVVEITHDRTFVTSSVDGECRGALELTSNLYRLPVGDNVLKPTADRGLESLQVSIDFSSEIVGITV